MYIAKLSRAKDYIFVSCYSNKGFGAPARKRLKRLRETPKAMAQYNHHRRTEKLQLLMLLNFDQGFHVVLDYPKGQRPETYEEAEENLKKCLYKVSRRFKKKGKDFKYIAITERGKRAAALHHHLIVEGYSEVVEELISVWGNHIKFNRMYEEGAYKDLAEYFTKKETKEEQTQGKSKYHRSRNLKEPSIQIGLCTGKIPEEPFIPKGYHLVRDTFVNGFNEMVGVRYQRYAVQKIDAPPEPIMKEMPKGVQKGHAKKPSFFERLKNIVRRSRGE